MGKLDLLHMYLAQQLGSCLIAAAAITHYGSQSKNPVVCNTLMLTRVVVSNSANLLEFLDLYLEHDIMPYKHGMILHIFVTR